MSFDFKKEEKTLYAPKTVPELVTVPPMTFAAIAGSGDPNAQGGAYQRALELLYSLCYTIKMSPKAGHPIDGYFSYVVPPLEGLWWMADGRPGVDYGNKAGFCWIAMIRQPDFVTPEVFAWACDTVRVKKGLDPAPARLMTYDEGLCVQCMHLGMYDDEPATLSAMDDYALAQGCAPDFEGVRRHHEIYLGDPRRTAPEKLRTVLRHPVKRL